MRIPALLLGVDVPPHVIHDKKIEQAVIVHVHPCAPHRPQRSIFLVGAIDSRLLTDIGECAVAVIVVELVRLCIISYKEISPAVVVIIEQRDAE